MPEVHGVDKGVDPNVKPERQILKSPNPTTQSNPHGKPRLGQGRAGLRRKMKVPTQMQVQPRDVSQIKEQNLSKQKEGIQTPLTKPTTDRHIEQRPKTCIMPEHIIRPKVNEKKFPFTQIP